jgi:hypothetical protein
MPIYRGNATRITLPSLEAILSCCIKCIENFNIIIQGGCRQCGPVAVPVEYQPFTKIDQLYRRNMINFGYICWIFAATHSDDETILFMKSMVIGDPDFLTVFFRGVEVGTSTPILLRLIKFADALMYINWMDNDDDDVDGILRPNLSFTGGKIVDEFRLDTDGFIAFQSSGHFISANKNMTHDAYIRMISARPDCWTVCDVLQSMELPLYDDEDFEEYTERFQALQVFARNYLFERKTTMLLEETNLASDVIGLIARY